MYVQNLWQGQKVLTIVEFDFLKISYSKFN